VRVARRATSENCFKIPQKYNLHTRLINEPDLEYNLNAASQ